MMIIINVQDCSHSNITYEAISYLSNWWLVYT